MARRREDDAEALTLEAVVEDPLLLLNAPEEELWALLEREVARAAKERGERLSAEEVASLVEDGLRVRRAVRAVFEALAAEPFDHAALEELKEAAEVAGDFYDRIAPTIRPLPNTVRLEGEAATPEDSLRWWSAEEGPPEDVEVSWVWGYKRMQDLDVEIPLVWDALGGAAKNAWEKLFGLLEVKRGDYIVCPVCGRIQKRGRSDQRYCSGACRASASRRRTDR